MFTSEATALWRYISLLIIINYYYYYYTQLYFTIQLQNGSKKNKLKQNQLLPVSKADSCSD